MNSLQRCVMGTVLAILVAASPVFGQRGDGRRRRTRTTGTRERVRTTRPREPVDWPGLETVPARRPADGSVLDMSKELALKDQQITKIKAVLAQRDKAVEKQQEAVAKRRERMQKSLQKASARQRTRIQKSIARLDKDNGMERVEATHAHKVAALLTAQQRFQWNSVQLQKLMAQEFRSQRLQPEQEQKLRILCSDAATRVKVAQDARFVPSAKTSLTRLILQKVLTREQRLQYQQQKRDRNPRKPARKPARRNEFRRRRRR